MAISVASCRICYVYFENGRLIDWALSRKASRNTGSAALQVRTWIEMLEPDVVVTEKINARCRKGAKSKALIDAVQQTTSEFELFDVAISKQSNFSNKYDEARHYASLYPDIQRWLPSKPKIWESEPRNASYIEALNLASQIIMPRSSSDIPIDTGRCASTR